MKPRTYFRLTLLFVGAVHSKMYQDETVRKDQLYLGVMFSSHISQPMTLRQEFWQPTIATTELDHLVLPRSYTKYPEPTRQNEY